MFPECWIGREGHINWPACSPNLNPLDFLVWGTLKNTVYNDILTRQENAYFGCMCKINSKMTERVRESFKYCLQKYIEVQGQHFEYLLK